MRFIMQLRGDRACTLRRGAAAMLLAALLPACAAPAGSGGAAPAATQAAEPPEGNGVAARGRAQPAPAPGAATGAPAEPIPIGLAAATTGASSLIGREQVAGAEIARDQVNGEGGIGGRPVELVVVDTGDDAVGARAAFEELINATPVLAIVGPTRSQQAFDAGYVAQQAGVPVLGASTTADGIPAIGDLVARVAAPSSAVAPIVLDAVLNQTPGIRRVAYLHAEDDRDAVSETLAQQRAAGDRGLDVAAVSTFSVSDADLAPPVARALEQTPDLVAVAASAVQGGLAVRELRDQGYDGPIVGSDAMNTPGIYPVCGAACEGLVLGQVYDPGAGAPGGAAFRDRWVEREGTEPPQHGAQAFAAIQVLAEALRAVETEQGLGTLNLGAQRAALNGAILAGRYETPLGLVTFLPDGEVVPARVTVSRVDMTDDGSTGRLVPLT